MSYKKISGATSKKATIYLLIFISNLEIYISSLNMYISSLEIYISSLKIELSRSFARFYTDTHKFFSEEMTNFVDCNKRY